MQTPFAPSSSVMSAVTMASICGMSGLGDGGTVQQVQLPQPGASGGAVPEFIQLKKGTEGYKTDWNNVAPSASIAWRPNVQGGFLRTILGDPEPGDAARRLFGGLRPPGPDRVHRPVRRATAAARISLTRNANTGTLVPAGESWPVLLSQTSRLSPAAFNPDPTYPIAIGANRADSLNAFAPDIKIARVADLDGRLRAVDLEGHGGRDPLRRQPRRQPVVGASTTTRIRG